MTDLPISVIKVYLLFICADLSTSFDSTGVGWSRWKFDRATSKPENIRCVLYAKRILTCNYDIPDNIHRDLTTCRTCSQATKLQTHQNTCPDAVFGLACNTSVGKCVYDCDSLKFCDYYHMVKVTLTGSDDKKPVSMCRQIRTELYVQPGPVRNLRVTAINNTTLRVEWKQPHDRYRYYDEYRYIVRYRDEKKHIKKLKTKDEDVHVVLTDLVPWGNYNITVWARPNNSGFRSIPQTVSTLAEEQRPAAPSDAKREAKMTSVAPVTVFLTVILAAASTALIAVITVFVKKRMMCERIAITLPEMMPFPVYEESGTSFVQVSRGCRNEADFTGFTAPDGDLCNDDPWLVRCTSTDVSPECVMQQQNCRKTSVDGGVKSGSCLRGNDIESDATSGDKPELIETWSYSTDSDLSAYGYRQVTLGSGGPWTVYNP